MKILILHTDPRDMGGVATFYRKLTDKFTLPVGHFVVGRRPDERGLLAKAQRLVRDYRQFARTLRESPCEIVHANPSLDRKSFLRDGLFLLLARLAGKPTVVTFHQSQEALLHRHGRWLFRLLYGKTNHFIVLSESLKRALQSWGCAQPVHREVTLIDDAVLEGFQIQQAIDERQRYPGRRILFLSRLHSDKGIYETLDALSILQARHPDLGLIVAGDGNELQGAKSFVRERSIANVEFTGYVRGEALISLFKSAYLYCLPTYYPEGLPSTVIESIAFGLPVVTRPVGGIADFFKNGEHGFATTSRAPAVIAELIEKLLTDETLYRNISRHNYDYGQKHFLASSAALRLEQIYTNLMTPPTDGSRARLPKREKPAESSLPKAL
jgi:glycosyltransferase involved in cell wall biosynthesis